MIETLDKYMELCDDYENLISIDQNYIQNMTMTQAIQITDPDEISNTVTQYLFDNAPPGSDPVLFARQYYIDGMSMTQAIQIINNIRSYTNN